MNYLRYLSKTAVKLAMAVLTVIPLLTVSSASLALPSTSNNAQFSQAELDQMLAPIALYPDTLLSQVLIASTYPLEVIQADRWSRSNADLKGEDAVKFVTNKDWDPSVKALVAFPDILRKMSDDIDWTQRVGDAFLANEGDVMDSVQRLRKRAYATGNLEKAEHIKVEQEDRTIIIEPAEERVVYVPVYDTRVVYGSWWWPDYPPVYWHYPSYTYTSGFYWGSSIYIGSTYYASSCHWRDRRVVVIDRSDRYYREPRYYNSRSIIRYEGSRDWQHNPVHRRGVAYYNDDLRNTFGSRRESYENNRHYREEYRERYEQRSVNGSGGTLEHGRVTYDNDRAEQLRERMNRDNQSDRHYPSQERSNIHIEPRQREIRSSESPQLVNGGFGNHDLTNRVRERDNRPDASQNQPQVERPRDIHFQRPREEQRPVTTERVDQGGNNNQPIKIDDSVNRRIESRMEPRPEQSNSRVIRGDVRGNDRQ